MSRECDPLNIKEKQQSLLSLVILSCWVFKIVLVAKTNDFLNFFFCHGHLKILFSGVTWAREEPLAPLAFIYHLFCLPEDNSKPCFTLASLGIIKSFLCIDCPLYRLNTG